MRLDSRPGLGCLQGVQGKKPPPSHRTPAPPSQEGGLSSIVLIHPIALNRSSNC